MSKTEANEGSSAARSATTGTVNESTAPRPSANDSEAARQQALKRFLTGVRASRSPEAFGINRQPSRPGRHVPGLSQKDVAYLLGTDRKSYERFEAGKRRFPAGQLAKLARILRLRSEEFNFLNMLANEYPVTPWADHKDARIRDLTAQVRNYPRPLTVRPGKFGPIAGPYVFATDPFLDIVASSDGLENLFGGEIPKNFFEFILNSDPSKLPDNNQYSVRRILLRLDMLRYTNPNSEKLLEIEEYIQSLDLQPIYVDDNFDPDQLGDIFPYTHPEYGPGVLHSTEVKKSDTKVYDGGSVFHTTFYASMDREDLMGFLQKGLSPEIDPASDKTELRWLENRAPEPEGTLENPHPAGVYNVLLGGNDYDPVDRDLAERFPIFYIEAARQNRAFMHRAMKWCAQQGVTQFLDIGAGIPAVPNLHQVVQGVSREARVVYIDNDPIVLQHADPLLIGTREGRIDYIQADAREPERILDHAREKLDFTLPISLSLIAVLHFITNDENPYGIVKTLLDALPARSYITISHATSGARAAEVEAATSLTQNHYSGQLRETQEIARFFSGCTLISPGIRPVNQLIFDGPVINDATATALPVLGGIGYKEPI